MPKLNNPRPRLEPLTYTTTEVADLLGISHRTVVRMVEDGRLPVVPKMGHRRIPRKAIQELVEGAA